MSNGLSDYTAKFNSKGTLANELVTDALIFTQLRATVKLVNEAAAKSNEIVQQLAQATSQFNNDKTPMVHYYTMKKLLIDSRRATT